MSQIGSITSKALSSHYQIFEKAQEKMTIDYIVGSPREKKAPLEVIQLLGQAYHYNYEFEKKVNPETVVWQNVETEYWINYLKELVLEHYNETLSELSKKIINNYNEEVKNFIQICPKEMIDKLEHPVTAKSKIKQVS